MWVAKIENMRLFSSIICSSVIHCEKKQTRLLNEQMASWGEITAYFFYPFLVAFILDPTCIVLTILTGSCLTSTVLVNLLVTLALNIVRFFLLALHTVLAELLHHLQKLLPIIIQQVVRDGENVSRFLAGGVS
jgi:hypothetical protein